MRLSIMRLPTASAFRQIFKGKIFEGLKSRKVMSTVCEENTQQNMVNCCHVKCLADEMTVPFGDWAEGAKKRDAWHNKVFLFGLANFVFASYGLRKWGLCRHYDDFTFFYHHD